MSKLERIHEFLIHRNCNWLLVTDSVEAQYITGIHSSNIVLCINELESHLFTDFRYRELAANFCRENGWIFHELKNKNEEVAALIYGTVAFQSNYMSVDQFELLVSSMPSVQFIRLGKEISSLFSVKESSEIEKIAKAAAIADSAFRLWQKEIRLGMNERELADLLEQFCRNLGSREPSFETIVLFGSRAALPHGSPSTESALIYGDTILVDFGCTVEGFCSDMTRTFYYGNPEQIILDRYEITLQAQLAGVAAVKAGVLASEVDKIVRDIIAEAGYGEQFGHGTGHGVGLRIHELPALNSKDSTVLAEGMVVTVEPGIYVNGESGVRIEDLLVVTKDGCRILSNTSKVCLILC